MGKITMRLKLYCHRYTHFKDTLVCVVSCPFRNRCADFALYYDEHREAVDQLAHDYLAKQRSGKVPQSLDPLSFIYLETKPMTTDAAYVWVSEDDHAETLTLDEVLNRAADGGKPKHIFKIAQEMELKFQLVPRQVIDKAKKKVTGDAAKVAARKAKNTNSDEDFADAESDFVTSRAA